MPPKPKVRRKVRIIKPGLQLKLCLVFLGVGITCILMQFTLLSETLSRIAMQNPDHSVNLAGSIYQALWRHLFITFALLVPLTLAIGIMVTHRVAGPIYRFENYLKSIACGENPGPCSIRKGDELQPCLWR